MMPRCYLSLFLLLFVSVGRPRTLTAGENIKAEKLGCSFTLPDGFQRTTLPVAGGQMEMAFMRGRPKDASFAALQLGSLGGTIGRGKLDAKMVEDSARAALRGTNASITRFDYRATRWKDFDFELAVAQVSKENLRLVTFTIQVPLAPEALQMSMVGPAADEARLLGEVQAILASLDGKTNWLSTSERLGRTVGALVGITVPIVVLLLFFLRRKRKAGDERGGTK